LEYIIQPGDTLYAIARRFGITLPALLAANPQIADPALIFPGQRITIPVPGPTVYVVQSGDTLAGIAGRFGLTLAQLLAANPQITNPNLIFAGQQINIPSPTPPPATTTYTVQPGDTLTTIARRFGTDVTTLLRLNPGIINPDLIFVGQQLVVPSSAPAAPPGCLVHVSTRAGRAGVWRSDASGGGALQLTRPPATPDQPVTSPRWSPDGRYIGYISGRGLYIMDPCGGFLRLADNAANYSWSNDSSRIAFSNEEGTFFTDLTGRAQKVAANLANPAWFPGDQRLAGSAILPDVRFGVLATIDIDGQNLRVVEPLVPAAFVDLSPDGRYAATLLGQGSAFLVSSAVTVYDFFTGSQVRLPGFEVEVQPGMVRDLSFPGGWSPDSTRLVYTTLVSSDGRGEIRVASPQGTILRSLARGFYPRAGWGPVADWIVLTLSDRPGTEILEPVVPRSIYVLNLRTGQEIRVTSTGDNYEPDWSGGPCPPCG